MAEEHVCLVVDSHRSALGVHALLIPVFLLKRAQPIDGLPSADLVELGLLDGVSRAVAILLCQLPLVVTLQARAGYIAGAAHPLKQNRLPVGKVGNDLS